MLRTSFVIVFCWLTLWSSAVADEEVKKLIDQLAEITEPDVGYSTYFSGSNFLPYNDSEQLGTLVLGGTYRKKSPTLTKIVAKGAAAVPMLVESIGDNRKIAMKPVSGMSWMEFSNEYDFNSRTRSERPSGVNRDWTKFGDATLDSHAITIGDLCFVALGQIVNRNYNATRYQPSGGMIVNSPTHSKALRKQIIADWSDFTTEKHRRLLIEDFEKPDYEPRRIGAYRRLSFYYPEMVEKLVLKTLEQPRFDTIKVHNFCRKRLYLARTPDRPPLYEKFIRENGKHYEAAVKQQLFEDLDTLEADEENRISPPLTEYRNQPRELLIQLFEYPKDVKSKSRPTITIMSESERARFVGSLTHDNSKLVGDAVKRIFLQSPDDDYLAPACLNCLASRGYADFLVEQLDRIDYSQRDANELHRRYLESIAKSDSPAVQQRLLRVIKETNNDAYFVQAVAGLGKVDDSVILENATRILSNLPENTKEGQELLHLVVKKFPKKAEETLASFLKPGTPERAESVCVVLWYGHPLSPKLLAPLLDDRRKIEGYPNKIEIRDRAATALSHAIEGIRYDSDWPQQKKEATIVKLKEYCAKQQ